MSSFTKRQNVTCFLPNFLVIWMQLPLLYQGRSFSLNQQTTKGSSCHQTNSGQWNSYSCSPETFHVFRRGNQSWSKTKLALQAGGCWFQHTFTASPPWSAYCLGLNCWYCCQHHREQEIFTRGAPCYHSSLWVHLFLQQTAYCSILLISMGFTCPDTLVFTIHWPKKKKKKAITKRIN